MQDIPKTLITYTQAAEIRGVTKQAISKLVSKGRFKVVEIGPHKFLNRNEVKNYVPHKNGRPPQNNGAGKSSPKK